MAMPREHDWATDTFRAFNKQMIKTAMERSNRSRLNEFTPEVIEAKIFKQARTKVDYVTMVNKLTNPTINERLVAQQNSDSLNQQGRQQVLSSPQQQQLAQNIYPNSSVTSSNQLNAGFNRPANVIQQQQQHLTPNQHPTSSQRMPDLIQHNPKSQSMQGVQQQADSGGFHHHQQQQAANIRPEWTLQQVSYPQQQQQPQHYKNTVMQQPQTSMQQHVHQHQQLRQPQPPQQQSVVGNLEMHPHASVPSISPAAAQQLMNNSPAGLKTPGSNHSAQSPASMSITAVPSPAALQASSVQPQHTNNAAAAAAANNVQVDDKVYMEKLKALQKYIEPLSRVIHKFNEDEEKHNKDYLKMKNLRDTLMNPLKRIPWSTLEKCEKVLQSWLDNKPNKQPQYRPTSPHQHMCQSIFNTIGNTTKFPLLNHTLKRTFSPSVQILCGDYTAPEVLGNKNLLMREEAKRIKLEDQRRKVPRQIIKELARLRSKFKFTLDRNWEGANELSTSIRIVGSFVDEDLPAAIPPIRLQVPRDYPDAADVEWIRPTTSQFVMEQKSTTDDNHAFHEALMEKMEEEQDNGVGDSEKTITNVLTCWEHCIYATLAKFSNKASKKQE